jgi:hypothetical protein
MLYYRGQQLERPNSANLLYYTLHGNRVTRVYFHKCIRLFGDKPTNRHIIKPRRRIWQFVGSAYRSIHTNNVSWSHGVDRFRADTARSTTYHTTETVGKNGLRRPNKQTRATSANQRKQTNQQLTAPLTVYLKVKETQ